MPEQDIVGLVTRFRLAHLSDPHLAPLPTVYWPQLLSKRIFGYINWRRNRGAALSRETVDALTDDMRAHSPDHTAVTGDLVNIALPAEYRQAATWLRSLGPSEAVTLVPGNHDAYIPGALEHVRREWADNICSDDGQVGFPLVRRRGDIVLIGLSSAVATLPGFATGTAGASQCDAAAAMLDRHDDAFKIVLIHHPPDTALAAGRRRLTDHAAVRALITQGNVDLVLHGHTHEPSLVKIATAKGSCAVLGVPSASSDGTKHAPASYALIDIDHVRGAIRITRRGPAAPNMPVERLETFDLAVSGAAH